MAKYDFDWEGLRERALALESEVAPGTELEAGVRSLYREQDGKLVLDTTLRDDLVAQVTREIKRDKLETENKRLKDERDRQTVTEALRAALTSVHVKPELMDAAMALHLAQNKFTIRDGKVYMAAKGGVVDPLSAAVQWAESGEVDALLDKSRADDGGGEFMRAVSRMKSLH